MLNLQMATNCNPVHLFTREIAKVTENRSVMATTLKELFEVKSNNINAICTHIYIHLFSKVSFWWIYLCFLYTECGPTLHNGI